MNSEISPLISFFLISKRPYQNKRSGPLCYACKQPGHKSAECTVVKDQKQKCYNCGESGHRIHECPKPREGEETYFVLIFIDKRLAFAECFVCKETGHIARDCPQNPNGMYLVLHFLRKQRYHLKINVYCAKVTRYAFGGGCRICGDKYHLAKDCPKKRE